MDRLQSSTQRPVKYNAPEDNARVHKDHAIRPGNFPTHFRVAGKLAQYVGMDAVFPNSLYFGQRIHGFIAKQKKGSLRQLVTLGLVNEVDGVSGFGPTQRHE